MKIKLFLFIFILTIGNLTSAFAGKDKSDIKALMIIPKIEFRDEEFMIPKKLLEEKGVKITVACNIVEPVKGMLGTIVKPDILLKDANIKEYNAIIFVGGIGSMEFWSDTTCLRIIKYSFLQKKILAAICLAPGAFAKAGIVNGKKITASSYAKNILKSANAIWQDKLVAVDGNLITGSGPEAAEEFAKSIIAALKL